MENHRCSQAKSLPSAGYIAETILAGKALLDRATIRLITECVSGLRDFNDTCELMCDVVQILGLNDYFDSDLWAALTLRSTIQKINIEFRKLGKLMFPPVLPSGVAPTRYFTLTDSANKLGLCVKPSPEHPGQLSGARGLVMTISQVYPGWWLLGTRWGEEEEYVWFDRDDFNFLIPVEVDFHEC